jgi:hypothetical protein
MSAEVGARSAEEGMLCEHGLIAVFIKLTYFRAPRSPLRVMPL